MPGVLGGSLGGGRFLMGEVSLHGDLRGVGVSYERGIPVTQDPWTGRVRIRE